MGGVCLICLLTQKSLKLLVSVLLCQTLMGCNSIRVRGTTVCVAQNMKKGCATGGSKTLTVTPVNRMHPITCQGLTGTQPGKVLGFSTSSLGLVTKNRFSSSKTRRRHPLNTPIDCQIRLCIFSG